MTPSSLIKLIQSLSGPEKRQFTLYSKTQGGNKDYLKLFSFIHTSKPVAVHGIRQAFAKIYPLVSWANTCNYLSKLLVDCLIDARQAKDPFFQLLHSMMGARILQERSLGDEAIKQIRNMRRQAAASQHQWMQYLGYRYELNHAAENNFTGLSYNDLIAMQLEAKEILKSLHHIQDHYTLFELLKFRLIHSGKVASDQDKKRLNDLMLSEMVLISNKSKNSFLSQKLHCLFQSFFFTDIGDYHSAFKSFHRLNALFEKNRELLDYPPLDYLSALCGILDSLATLSNSGEMEYYLEKLEKLEQPLYPEHFQYQVRKAIVLYRLLLLIHDKKWEQAKRIVEPMEKNLLAGGAPATDEKQSELYFYACLLYFLLRDFRKAHLLILHAMTQVKLVPQLLVHKAIRLLNIIIYYEKNEKEYLESELRSYKRFSQKGKKLLQTEKLVLHFIQAQISGKKMLLKTAQTKIYQGAQQVAADRYEKGLLRYFDFAAWVVQSLESKPGWRNKTAD